MNNIEWRAGRYRRDPEAVRARHVARPPRVGFTQGGTHPNEPCTLVRAAPPARSRQSPLRATFRRPLHRSDRELGGRLVRLEPRAPLVD